jgi:protein-tyrosine-phosphatase/DNA-binding transcriptional ArsR family regulator
MYRPDVASTASSTHLPPVVFRLVGHPVRWRLLSELAWSDRRVNELVGALDEPQSLVSYHLRQLRAAEIVASRRSSFDGRDSYYSLNVARCVELLGEAGTALHPALMTTVPTVGRLKSMRGVRRVLFLCTGNSSRSQMAQALLEQLADGLVDVFSAGSRPKPLHANAVRVMRARGVDISGREATHLDVFSRRRFDYVISLCDRVREVCPEFPGNPPTIHWSIADPAAEPGSDDESLPAFEQTASVLEMRIGFLLHQINETEGATR